MKRFRKIYLEISNICNLKCAFCPGTKRKKRSLTEDEFRSLVPKLRPYTDYLYFHLMGEPLCHPELERFLQLAGDVPKGLDILHESQSGKLKTLVVRGDVEKITALVSAGRPAYFDILPLSLEEIFIYELGGAN